MSYTEALVPVPNDKETSDSAGAQKENEDMMRGDAKFGGFKTTRPKHIGRGLAAGTGEVVKGVGYGVGGLVAAPIVGAKEHGAGGFFTGMLLGVTGAVVCPIAGVASGARQVGIGAKNTGEACRQQGKDTVYDKHTGKWREKYGILEEVLEQRKSELTIMENQAKDLDAGLTSTVHGQEGRKVADTKYYDVLGVPPDASQATIRKAYYKLARETHPDKHQNNPAAKEQFQRIGEAYQVLGDESRREQYDKHGQAATETMEFMDSSVFFAMLFGSDEMEPYIGKLILAAALDGGDPLNLEGTALSYLRQEVRELTLALELRNRLEPYIVANNRSPVDDHAIAVWVNNIGEEADRLCHRSFGSPMIAAIGFMYENQADRFIGKKESLSQQQKAKWRLKKRQMATKWSIMSEAVAAAKVNRKAQKQSKKKSESTTSAGGSENHVDYVAAAAEQAAVQESLKHIMAAMLNICITDIYNTLQNTCNWYLHDKAVGEQEQRLRAEGLRFLGHLLTSSAQQNKGSEDFDPLEMLHEAAVRANQKMDESTSQPDLQKAS